MRHDLTRTAPLVHGQSGVVEPSPRSLPLCIDLDGTLVLTDTLVEGLLSVVSRTSLLRDLPKLMTTDRALLKRRVSELADVSAETLPYNDELLGFIRGRRAAGQRIILATAADSRIAHAVADHLQLFDDVVCSDGETNLKGEAKASALVARFGEKGFEYAGNDFSDLPVWSSAAAILTANASASVVTAANRIGPITASFDRRVPVVKSLIKAMRPHQWSKNLLVFVPLVTAHAVMDFDGWVAAILLLLSFCAVASATYIVNDLLDLSADRKHPRKKSRPFASGALSIQSGVLFSVLLFVGGFVLAAMAGAVWIVALYVAVALAYSIALKTYPLVDVFTLAGLYTMRVLAGGVATGYHATLWLLAFSGFTFLSLALVKRSEELLAIERDQDKRSMSRRGYQAGDRLILQMFGCASAFASSVVLALFVGSSSALQNYQASEVLWLIVPTILFWQCRLWLSTARGYMHDDPIVFALRDWVSWLTVAAVLLIMFVASTGIVSIS